MLTFKRQVSDIVWLRNLENLNAKHKEDPEQLCQILQLKWYDRVPNSDLWSMSNQEPINIQMKWMKWQWAKGLVSFHNGQGIELFKFEQTKVSILF